MLGAIWLLSSVINVFLQGNVVRQPYMAIGSRREGRPVNRKSGDRVASARHGKENNSAVALSTSQSRRRASPRDDEPSQDDLGNGPRQSAPAAVAEQTLSPADEAWCDASTYRSNRNPSHATAIAAGACLSQSEQSCFVFE